MSDIIAGEPVAVRLESAIKKAVFVRDLGFADAVGVRIRNDEWVVRRAEVITADELRRDYPDVLDALATGAAPRDVAERFDMTEKAVNELRQIAKAVGLLA